jgi:hypothetical protein
MATTLASTDAADWAQYESYLAAAKQAWWGNPTSGAWKDYIDNITAINDQNTEYQSEVDAAYKLETSTTTAADVAYATSKAAADVAYAQALAEANETYVEGDGDSSIGDALATKNYLDAVAEAEAQYAKDQATGATDADVDHTAALASATADYLAAKAPADIGLETALAEADYNNTQAMESPVPFGESDSLGAALVHADAVADAEYTFDTSESNDYAALQTAIHGDPTGSAIGLEETMVEENVQSYETAMDTLHDDHSSAWADFAYAQAAAAESITDTKSGQQAILDQGGISAEKTEELGDELQDETLAEGNAVSTAKSDMATALSDKQKAEAQADADTLASEQGHYHSDLPMPWDLPTIDTKAVDAVMVEDYSGAVPTGRYAALITRSGTDLPLMFAIHSAEPNSTGNYAADAYFENFAPLINGNFVIKNFLSADLGRLQDPTQSPKAMDGKLKYFNELIPRKYSGPDARSWDAQYEALGSIPASDNIVDGSSDQDTVLVQTVDTSPVLPLTNVKQDLSTGHSVEEDEVQHQDVTPRETPQDRLRKAFQRLVDKQTTNFFSWSGQLDYSKGFVVGMWEGVKGLGTLVEAAGAVIGSTYDAITFPLRAEADAITSWLFGIEPDVYKEPYNYVSQKILQARRFVKQMQPVLNFLVEHLGDVDFTNLPMSLASGSGLSRQNQKLLGQAMDVATDLAALVVNELADVTPYDAGKVAGFITEQVAEQVLIILLTEGGGEGAEVAALPARIASVLEKSKMGAAAIERLQPLIKVLREMKGSEELGEALTKIGEALRTGSRGTEAVEGGKDVVLLAEILDHCFAAGTPILTPSGEKAIEHFEVGDEILTRPEDSPDAPLRTSTVEKVFHLSGLTLELRVGGRVVTTTEKHPFYIVGKGWTWAGELKPGDLILGDDGRSTAVESIAPTNRHESLYNLRVAFDRTYFVGSRAWGFSLWAHNTYVTFVENGVTKIKSIVNGVEKVLSEAEADALKAETGASTIEEAVAKANEKIAEVTKNGVNVTITGTADALHEEEQARRLGEILGGGEFQFFGNSSQGVEGMFHPTGGANGVPFSMKLFHDSDSLLSILREIRRNSNAILSAGSKGAIFYGEPTRFTVAQLAEFAKNGPLLKNIIHDGAFIKIILKGSDGVIEITVNGIRVVR